MAVLLSASAIPPGDAGAKTARIFVFDRFNKAYEDLAPPLEPIRQGPLTIRLSSPKHVLVLLSHVLQVRPNGDGTHDALLQAEFEGSGDLTADLDLLGLPGRIQDRFLIPLQKKKIHGRVRMDRVAEGYRITPLELPEQVEVEIRTGMGNRLVDWCRRMAQVPLSPLECGGLDRSLSQLEIPMPKDETYVVSEADLTEEERRALDEYLGP